jgi:hypothetical protein
MSNTNDLFILAAKKKYFFASGRGAASTYDLFDLSLDDLDKVAINLDDQIQKAGKKSFVNKRTDSTTELDNKLEIVKYVIQTKQEEIDARKLRAEKQAKRAELTEALREKELSEIKGKSKDELLKELAALD